MKSYVVSINISEKKGVIKIPVQNAQCLKNHGIKGDAHAGDWHRQISLLALESIDKMNQSKKLENQLIPGQFAENITTKGICLYKLPVGTKLQIGETIQEVTQIGKKCHSGCQIKTLVGDCVMPREGIFTKIIKEGIVNIGDEIIILD